MTELILSGTGKWFGGLVRPDDKFGAPKYTLNFYPDAGSMAIFEDAKLKLKVRNDEDGTFVKLSRNHNPVIFDGKTISEGGPPEIVDKDGKPWDTSKIIGNGSTVAVRIETYKSKFGNAHRLLKVRVENLVEYTAPDNADGGGASKGEAVPF